MKAEIGDEAATLFSEGFYDALGGGREYEDAYHFGCSAIETMNLPDSNIPALIRGRLDNFLSIKYSPTVAELESFFKRFINADDRTDMIVAREVENDQQSDTIVVRPNIESVSIRSYKVIRNVIIASILLIDEFGSTQHQTAYVIQSPSGFRLDIDASIGRCEMTFAAFIATRPKASIMFRCTLRLSNRYYFDFRNAEKTHFSISIDHPTMRGSLDGYLFRYTPLGVFLYSILKDGEQHYMTIQVRQVGEHADCVIIEKLISESWVVTKVDVEKSSSDTV